MPYASEADKLAANARYMARWRRANPELQRQRRREQWQRERDRADREALAVSLRQIAEWRA